MVYIELHFVLVFIIVDAVDRAMIFFTGFASMHFMVLGAVWASYLPRTFLCSMIVFTTFIAACNAQIVVAVIYMPPYFKFLAHYLFTSVRINLYYQVLVFFPVFKHKFWQYFTLTQFKFRVLLNYCLRRILRSNVFWYVKHNYSGVSK